MTHPTPAAQAASTPGDIPVGSPSQFFRYLKYDLVSGFLVFLIALPLCLAISLASGYPAIAGVFTAIIGGVVGGLISNSEMTIKGPAAGLIVIAVGCVKDFGFTAGENPAQDFQAYRLALAVGVAAAAIQILLALVRSGALGEFFPTSVVHGMLAAIGVIIISKQIPFALGLSAKGEPLELLREIPTFLRELNPEIAFIALVSLIILFGKPLLPGKWIKLVPSQLVVVVIAVCLGVWFDLTHEHTYTLVGHQYTVGEQHLVKVPFNLLAAVTLPDFTALGQAKAWWWVGMYVAIGSVESLLSAKAVDLLDPWKRTTNLNRDLLAVGIGNLAAAFVGGLPMISEIVRSRANIDNGARTRYANLFHGVFLCLCVALIPAVIHRIPLAALAAMLIYTGFRLAHPREFLHVLRVGPEQLIVFVCTIVGVLATELLTGIGIGMGVKLLIHFVNGAPLRTLFWPSLDITEMDEQTLLFRAGHSAVFSNWLIFRARLVRAGLKLHKDVILDLSDTRLVDHTVMEKLHELEGEFAAHARKLTIVGLEQHNPMSSHPQAARRGPLAGGTVRVVNGKTERDAKEEAET